MLKCRRCSALLDLTVNDCPACGAAVELGRLTGILGVVCRSCDAYNEPGASACVACGAPLRGASDPSSASPRGAPARAPSAPSAPSPPSGAPVLRAFPKGAEATARLVPPVLAASAERPGSRRGAAGTGTQLLEALRPGPATLVLLRGDGGPGQAFALDAEAVEVGSAGAVRFPGDAHLAPRHATFLRRGGAVHVRDEGAPGGVFVRLRGVSAPLGRGDVFALGERVLRFAGPLPPAPPPRPDGTLRLGAPRPAGAVVVEELLAGGRIGRVHVRAGGTLSLGRAGCAIALGDDPLLSQVHAELVVEPDGAVRLRDVGSADGTYVRIRAGAERELRDGDCVRIGREVLRVSIAAPAG